MASEQLTDQQSWPQLTCKATGVSMDVLQTEYKLGIVFVKHCAPNYVHTDALFLIKNKFKTRAITLDNILLNSSKS